MEDGSPLPDPSWLLVWTLRRPDVTARVQKARLVWARAPEGSSQACWKTAPGGGIPLTLVCDRFCCLSDRLDTERWQSW